MKINYVTKSSPLLPNYEKEFLESNYEMKLRELEYTEIEESRKYIFDNISQIDGEDFLEREIIKYTEEKSDSSDDEKENKKEN